jgi:uncharacterized membrane protein YhiD involved in acid resistance
LEELLGTFRVVPHVAALAGAYALALPIGWDRERAERSAGLRTFPLVAVAVAAFTILTLRLLSGPDRYGLFSNLAGRQSWLHLTSHDL